LLTPQNDVNGKNPTKMLRDLKRQKTLGPKSAAKLVIAEVAFWRL